MDKQKCYLIGVLCLSFVYGYVSAWAAVAVKGVTGTSFKVEWSPVENAVGYEVSVTKQVVPIKYRIGLKSRTQHLYWMVMASCRRMLPLFRMEYTGMGFGWAMIMTMDISSCLRWSMMVHMP